MQLMPRAFTLLEVLIALTLGALMVDMLTQAVVAQRRAEARMLAAPRDAATAEEVAQLAATSLSRIAHADSFWTRGDTAIEWRATLGIAVACAIGGDSVAVPDSGLRAWWETPPDTGDRVELGHVDGTWTVHRLSGLRVRANGLECGAAQRTLKLTPAPPPYALPAVPIVRVLRRSRLTLYRASDGTWWFGARRCSDATLTCAAVQPISGPLVSPPAGLTFVVNRDSGVPTVTVTARAGVARRSAAVVIRE